MEPGLSTSQTKKSSFTGILIVIIVIIVVVVAVVFGKKKKKEETPPQSTTSSVSKSVLDIGYSSTLIPTTTSALTITSTPTTITTLASTTSSPTTLRPTTTLAPPPSTTLAPPPPTTTIKPTTLAPPPPSTTLAPPPPTTTIKPTTLAPPPSTTLAPPPTTTIKPTTLAPPPPSTTTITPTYSTTQSPIYTTTISPFWSTPLSSAFYIYNHADWQSAIVYSQQSTSTYSSYILMTDLTFDTTNHMFLNSATAQDADTNYIYIKASQTFDGNNHTITVSPGSQPSNGLAGILRAQGSGATTRANIVNLRLVVQNGVVYHSNNWFAAALISCTNTGAGSSWNNFENIILDSRATAGNVNFLVGNQALGLRFYNILISYSNPISTNTNGCFFSGIGTTTISLANIIVINTDSSINSFHNVISGSVACPIVIKNMYVYAPNFANTSATTNAYFMLMRTLSGSLTLTDFYFVFGSYSTLYVGTSPKFIVDNSSAPTISITNFYSNLDRDSTYNNNFIKNITNSSTAVITLQNCQNRFLWSSTPTFSGGFNTVDAGPYRLLSFMSYPFDITSYTSYSSTPYFLEGSITPVMDGLMMYYSFDGAQNNLVFNTVSKSYDATLMGGASISSTEYVVGTGALMINSASDYVALPSITTGMNGLSIAIWFNLKSFTGTYPSIVRLSDTTSNTNMILLFCQNSQLQIQIKKNGAIWLGSSVVSSGNIIDNKWHHVVWNITSTGYNYVYLDNILTYSNTTTAAYPTNIQINYCAINSFNANAFTSAFFDDFRMYNRVLTVEEINQLYQLKSYYYTTQPPFQTTTIVPTYSTLGVAYTTMTPTPPNFSYSTIWLDASSSSNWSNNTWINNSSFNNSTDATPYKGVFSASSWVSNVINGMPGVYFDGTNALSTADPAGTYNAGLTLFVVFKPTANVSNRTLISRTTGSGKPSPFDIYNIYRLVGDGTSNSIFKTINLDTLVINQSYIFAFRLIISGTNAYATEWHNGDVKYYNMILSSYGDIGTNVQIGSRDDGTTSFKGYMGEIIMYNTVLSDTQVVNVNQYLSQKWKINITTTYSNTINAQYVEIAKIDNLTEAMNIAELQIFDNTGTKLTPVSGQMSSTLLSVYTIDKLYDSRPDTFAHTNLPATGSVYVRAQLYQDYNIGKVVVVNRQDCCGFRMIGCVLKLMRYVSPTYYVVYLSPIITENILLYEFTFETQNTLILSYYGTQQTENISVYVDNILITTETLSTGTSTTPITQTCKLGFAPTSINIVYNNEGTSGDVYLTKLDYNGKDLRTMYVNASSDVQTSVRQGLLAWGMSYTFYTVPTTLTPTTPSVLYTTTLTPFTTLKPTTITPNVLYTTTITPTPNVVYTTPVPLLISNIQLWLDASNYDSITFSSGYNVQTWNDLSGYNRHATLFGTTSPVYTSSGINSKPAITFTTSSPLSCPMPSGTTSTAITVFVVYQLTGTIPASQGTTLVSRTANNYPRPLDIYNDKRLTGSGPTASVKSITSTFNIITNISPNVFVCVAQASLYKEWVNGTQILNTTGNPTFNDTDATAFYIATRGDKNTGFVGYMSEIIVYNTILTDTEITTVTNYLRSKWSI